MGLFKCDPVKKSLRKGKAKWNKRIRYKYLMSDAVFINHFYTKKFGKALDLLNPRTFSEKLQWMKLYYNDPLYSTCADKYKVREYITEKGFGHILNELIAVYDDPARIDPADLPDKFALKATHGCGWNIIVRDKNEFTRNLGSYRELMKFWLRQDYGIFTRESHYSPIIPRIVCEKFLEDNATGDLRDYKFFCFHGEPKLVQMHYNRSREEIHTRRFYDTEWNEINMMLKDHNRYENDEPKPDQFDEMLEICRTLSQGFIFVRVDLYLVNGKIYFGEMTFTPSSGMRPYRPEEIDHRMGEWLRLPEKSSPYVML